MFNISAYLSLHRCFFFTFHPYKIFTKLNIFCLKTLLIFHLNVFLAFKQNKILILVFSSPEHEVLMVSYCGQWLSVVRCRPSSCVVRRASSVVRCPSTFDVYTLETTFLTWFWWNLIRMFVLTISRPSSNMGNVRSKTRSPGQILGNSCLHSRGHICDLILMILCQNVCIDNI